MVAPDAFYTAGDYSRDARSAIAAIAGRGRLPIVTGGSGLYLRALLLGLFPGPQRSPELRDRLLRKAETRGALYLHRILRRLDSTSAARIHSNDVAKVVRAIEICLDGARPMSEAWNAGREGLTGYRVLRIGLNPGRQQLYARINARARDMFSQGLIDETKDLIAHYGNAPALDSLGYRQAARYLAGALTLEEAVAAASQGHRNYAKRQMTWFRREPEVCWLNGFGQELSLRAEAESLAVRACAGLNP